MVLLRHLFFQERVPGHRYRLSLCSWSAAEDDLDDLNLPVRARRRSDAARWTAGRPVRSGGSPTPSRRTRGASSFIGSSALTIGTVRGFQVDGCPILRPVLT